MVLRIEVKKTVQIIFDSCYMIYSSTRHQRIWGNLFGGGLKMGL